MYAHTKNELRPFIYNLSLRGKINTHTPTALLETLKSAAWWQKQPGKGLVPLGTTFEGWAPCWARSCSGLREAQHGITPTSNTSKMPLDCGGAWGRRLFPCYSTWLVIILFTLPSRSANNCSMMKQFPAPGGYSAPEEPALFRQIGTSLTQGQQSPSPSPLVPV